MTVTVGLSYCSQAPATQLIYYLYRSLCLPESVPEAVSQTMYYSTLSNHRFNPLVYSRTG